MSKIVTETLQLKNLQKKKKKTFQTKEIKKSKNKLSNKKKRNSKETKSNSCGSNKKENFQQQKITKIETNVEEEQQQQQQQEQLLLHDSNSNNSNNTNNKEEEELEAEELQLQQRRQQQQLYQSQLSPNYFQYLRKNQTALPLLITTTTTRTATTTTKTHAATDDIKNNNKHNINNKTKKKKAKIHTKNEIIDEEEFFFDDDHNNNNNNDGEQRLFDDDKNEDKDEEKDDDNSNSKSVENAVDLNCLRDREQVEQKTKTKSPIKTIAATSTASATFADQVLFAASLSAENMPLSQGHYTSKSAFAATKRASIKASRLNNDESLSKQRKCENAQDNKGNNNNQLHSRFNNNNNNFFSNFNNHKQSSSNNNNKNHPNQQCQNLLNSSTKQPLFTSSTTTTTSSTFSTPHLQLLSTGIYQCKKNNNSNNNKNDSHSNNNNNTIKQNIQFSYCVGESLARYGRLQEAFDIYALIASKQLDGSVPLDRLGALVTCLITYMRQLNKKLQTDYDSNVNAAGVRRKFGVDVEPSGAAAAAAAAASLTTAPSIAEAIAIVDVDAESLDLFQTKSSHHNSPYANVFRTKTALLANTNEDYDPLLCTLCSDILRCPVTANCGHTFCRQCCEVITMCNICHVKFPRIVFDDFAVLPTTTTTAAAISTSAAAQAAAATTTSIAAFANFNCRSNGGGNQTLLRGGLNSFNNFDTTVAPPTTTQQSNNALQESGSGGGSDSSRSGNGVVAFNTGTGGNFMSQTSSSSLSSASMSSSSANSGSGFASSSSSLSTTLSSSSHYTRAVTTSTVSLTTATATTTMASTPSTIMRGGNGNGNIGSESSGGSGLSPGSLRSNGNSNSFKFMTDVTVRRLVEKWWGPDLQAQKISETAASHMHLNLLDDALKFCNASLEKSPTNFKSLLLRGEVLRKLNHFQSSLSDVDNALRVRYTSAKAHYLRALILSDLGRIDEALFENCLAISLDRATNLSGSEIFQHDLAKNLQKLLAQTPKSKVSLVMPRNCIGALPYSILAEHRLRRKQSLVLSNAADYNLNCLEREYVTCPADLGVKSCDFISADEDFLIDNEYAVVDREAHEVVAAYNDCELMTLRRPTSRKHFRRKWAPKETELMPTTMALSDARCSVLFRGVLERTQQELQRLKKLEVSGGDSQKKQLMQVPQNLIDASDFDCVLCCRTFWKPVVTPCGHTYCLVCLDRCMDYTSSCPLCMSPLVEPSNGGGAANMYQGSSPSPVPFMLAKRSVTKFLEAAMKRFIPESYDKRFRQEMDLEPTVPLFICTTAFPYVPCPLFVYEPRYRLMVRRAVESGQKHFGIVQPHSGKSRYFDVGTILDIRDCVLLGDGCSILSTIGCKRFKILARNEKDGYETAKVEYIYDEMIADENVPFVMNMHAAVLTKAIDWFDSLSVDLKQEIFQSFGEMPPLEENWESIADGPAWAWWIIALLPLSQQLKVDILATTSLEKRLRAIEKTLDYLSGTFQRTQQNCGVVVVQQQQQQHNQQQHQQCNEHNNSQQQQQQQQNTQDECCQRTNSMMMGDG